MSRLRLRGSRGAIVVKLAGLAGWLVLAGGAIAWLAAGGDVSAIVANVVVGMVYPLLLVQVITAGVILHTQRAALLSLAVGVLLWAAGSAILNAGGQAAATQFPAPGEWLFLSAYLGFAAFVLLDVASHQRTSLGTWLEMLIICGGASSLAGIMLVTPFAARFGGHGVPLLIALLYPLLDIALMMMIVGQVILRRRPLDARTAILVVALVLLLTADTSLVVNLSSGAYGYGLWLSMTWFAAFLLLVASATRPVTSWGENVLTQRFSGLGVVVAAAVAVAVLAFQPRGEARPFVVVPAVVTLLAVGVRLVLALREANSAAEALRLSQTDELTGLPNRRAVVIRLEQELARRLPMALLLLDLDGFKEINDSLGHSAGDTLLQTVASRLRFTLPKKSMVARLGGDEFALVVEAAKEDELLDLAETIRDVVRKPVRVDGLELAINGSIGITTRDDGEENPGDILRRADVAMYRAKDGRHGVMTYHTDRDDFSRQRLLVAADLREGIAAGQLEVWYQPQINAQSTQVIGVEALVRWRHPLDGLVSPGVFLPVARRTGLMSALSEAVIRSVVADARRWRAEGHTFAVAINIAPPELLSGPVLGRLFHEAASAGLTDNSLIVEVTEDSFISDPARARELIEDIRMHQLQVSIDDYGTGYSSLAYLRELPVHELKMDRSFVSSLRTDPRSRMIVSTTNQMAHGLGLRTVAEGVEDQETAQDLIDLGFDVLQGYHFARPMPASELSEWINQWSAQRVSV